MLSIKIKCLEGAFLVTINGNTLDQLYPYRIKLYRAIDLALNVADIPVKHFKWISLKMPVKKPASKQCPPGLFLTKTETKFECLNFTEAIRIMKSKEFGEKSYRYKIVGNDTWNFIDSSGKVVLSARGPIDWTRANFSLDELSLTRSEKTGKLLFTSK